MYQWIIGDSVSSLTENISSNIFKNGKYKFKYESMFVPTCNICIYTYAYIYIYIYVISWEIKWIYYDHIFVYIHIFINTYMQTLIYIYIY